jgi:hypothetical protein
VRGAWGGASIVAGVAVALGLSGCAPSEQDEATRAADRFAAAVRDGDSQQACSLLAPATVEELERSSGAPCADAVLEEAAVTGERVGVSTFGAMSQVRYAEDVVFLARFDAGWRVVAAGCVAERGGLYACGIEGR